VQVIYGEKATQHANGSWHLSDGSRLDADVVYNAVGGRPHTAFLQPLGILDARGAIKVQFCIGALETPQPSAPHFDRDPMLSALQLSCLVCDAWCS
jgi:hypothetical protein